MLSFIYFFATPFCRHYFRRCRRFLRLTACCRRFFRRHTAISCRHAAWLPLIFALRFITFALLYFRFGCRFRYAIFAAIIAAGIALHYSLPFSVGFSLSCFQAGYFAIAPPLPFILRRHIFRQRAAR